MDSGKVFISSSIFLIITWCFGVWICIILLVNDIKKFYDGSINEIKEFKTLSNGVWRGIMDIQMKIDNNKKLLREKRQYNDNSYNLIQGSWTTYSRIPCPPGPRGPPGSNGLDGIPGEDGKDGINGISGDLLNDYLNPKSCQSCPPGRPGPRGLNGSPGLKGPDGNQGEIGRAGKPGRPGIRGLKGNHGVKGMSGKNGSPGRPGKPGIRLMFSPGLPGKPGPPGRQGKPGNPGKKAPPGIPGPRGPPGCQGVPGEDGLDGNPGKQGLQGIPGPDAAYCPCPPRILSSLVPAKVPLNNIRKNQEGTKKHPLIILPPLEQLPKLNINYGSMNGKYETNNWSRRRDLTLKRLRPPIRLRYGQNKYFNV
uniref:Col_cuticle_N domain-containing protein n=1 Tax=Parastrongyloides trichosuri TaxID=131310 RepID=A0A0N4ZMI1_PARTI